MTKINAIYGYKVFNGISSMFNLEVNDERRYPLNNFFRVQVRTDAGTLLAETDPGFIFDGRSGPRLIDFYVPNLGSLNERLGWYLHDVLGYGQSLSFKETNRFLEVYLRDMCGYKKSKAWLIKSAVSISDSWYGWPDENDWCICNTDKVRTYWTPLK